MSFAGGLPGNEGPELKNFDPLKISENAPEWVPWYREAELKHGRIAMLATAGFIGAEFFQLPGEVHQVSSVAAHDASVSSGALTQILFWVSLLEILTTPALANTNPIAKSNGWFGAGNFPSDRQPGEFSFDPLRLGSQPAAYKKYQINELKNGRLAMLAFSGIVTQAVLSGKAFPYF